MDTAPPSQVTLEDNVEKAVAPGSKRIVWVCVFVLLMVLGFTGWGMVQTHRRRQQLSASVPSAMDVKYAQPAQSRRRDVEQSETGSGAKNVSVTVTHPSTPETTPADNPVIRFQPGTQQPAAGLGNPQQVPPIDPLDPDEAAEMRARESPMTIPYKGAPNIQPPMTPGNAISLQQTDPASIPEQIPMGQDPALADALRQYGVTGQQKESPSGPEKQSAFAKGSDTGDIVVRDEPLPEFAIARGSGIPAEIATGTNSQLPGQIEAVVSADVFNQNCGLPGHGCYVEIPRGSRLVGEYNAEVAYGQNRLQVAWLYLYRPGYRAIELDRMQGYSNDGAGLTGKVDNHWKRIISGALLTSTLQAGFAISQSRNQNALYPSAGNAAAAGVGQSISELGNELTAKNVRIPPYIKLIAGSTFTVKVTRDLIFDGPFKPVK